MGKLNQIVQIINDKATFQTKGVNSPIAMLVFKEMIQLENARFGVRGYCYLLRLTTGAIMTRL